MKRKLIWFINTWSRSWQKHHITSPISLHNLSAIAKQRRACGIDFVSPRYQLLFHCRRWCCESLPKMKFPSLSMCKQMECTNPNGSLKIVVRSDESVGYQRVQGHEFVDLLNTLTSLNVLLNISWWTTFSLRCFMNFNPSGMWTCKFTKQYWPRTSFLCEAVLRHWSKSPYWSRLPWNTPLGNFALASCTNLNKNWIITSST